MSGSGRPAKGEELLPKEQRFVLEYLKDHNATRAAIRAGYSERSAESQGSRLLRKSKVFEAIRGEVQRQLEVLKLDAELVLAQMKAVATLDPAKAYGTNGDLLPIHEMPPEVRAAIAGFEQEVVERTAPDAKETQGSGEEGARVQVRVTKVKWYPKHPAAEMIAKHAGLLRQQVDVTHHVATLEELLAEAEAEDGDEGGDG